MTPPRTAGWAAVAFVALVALGPVALIAFSPYLSYRAPVYVAAGVAGALALSCLLIQPLLAAGALPGLTLARARRWHGWTGCALTAAVAVHIGGLYLTSPPDTIDALLLVSPTPFSIWGVTAMWALIAAALMAALRRQLRLRPRLWAVVHNGLGLLVVLGSVIHAVLIDGTMEPVSKWILCLAALGVTLGVTARLRLFKAGGRTR